MKPSTAPRSASRFTLIELLVVITIIAVLAAILLPVLGRARRKAYVVVCINNLSQVSRGLNMYADDNDGFLPAPKPVGPTLLYRGGGTWVHFRPDRSKGYNFITPMKQYFGGTLNAVFRCPLAIPEYQEGGSHGNFDKPEKDGVKSIPYQLYFNKFHPDYGMIKGPNYMMKIGDTFRLPGGGNDGEGEGCSVIASDLVHKGIGAASNKHRIRTTHPSPLGDSVNGYWNYRNGSCGWAHMLRSDGNFAGSDGSVRHYSRITTSDHHNGSEDFYHLNASSGRGQVVPKDMCE